MTAKAPQPMPEGVVRPKAPNSPPKLNGTLLKDKVVIARDYLEWLVQEKLIVFQVGSDHGGYSATAELLSLYVSDDGKVNVDLQDPFEESYTL